MPNLTIPRNGGSIRFDVTSQPSSTITFGTLPSDCSVSGGTYIKVPKNKVADRTFNTNITATTVNDANYYGNASVSCGWTVSQQGGNVEITSPAYSAQIPATATSIQFTVTATSAGIIQISGGQIQYPVSMGIGSGTTTSSFQIPVNYESYVQYYGLSAWLTSNTAITDYVSVQQVGYSGPTLTGISLVNLTQISDIPASGGSADYHNFSYQVLAHYSDGITATTIDVTSAATISSNTVTAASSTIETRHSVGTIWVEAEYYDGPNPFTAGAGAYVYQAAFNTNINLLWQNGTFQNNTQNYAGVATRDNYVTCSYGTKGTSFTTRGTVASHSTGDLYVGAETGYEVPPETVSFTIDGFPINIVPIDYDNCYITIYFSQGTKTISIGYSTTAPTLLTQSVDFSEFDNSSDVYVSMTINFVKT